MRIGWTMRGVEKAVIGVLAGIQSPNAKQLMKENSVQQVIYGIWVVGMALQNLVEFLNRALVVHVVEMLEGLGVKRIGWPEHVLITFRLHRTGLRKWRRLLRPHYDRQQYEGKNSGPNEMTRQFRGPQGRHK